MILDLEKIPILVLNLEEDAARRESIVAQLAAFGLQAVLVSGVRCKPSIVGCALSHLRALALPGLRPPFLVLEDDTRLFEDRFRTLYDVPDDTDALYLGHSAFGLGGVRPRHGLRWGETGKLEFSEAQPGYLRFLNVLARHAILYISPRFHEAAIEANQRALYGHPFPIPGDVEYAGMQPQFNVLATEDPLCFQCDDQGRNRSSTRRSVLDYSLDHSLEAGSREPEAGDAEAAQAVEP